MNTPYALANYEDLDEIPNLDLNETDVPSGQYTTTIQNVFSRQCAEIRTNTEPIIHHIHQVSKRRLRELVQHHNNELFSHMQRPDRTPSTAGIAEVVCRRYGRDVPSLRGNSQNTTRDLNLDSSMNTVIEELDEGLKSVGGESVHNYITQMKWLFTQYKSVGEEVLRLESLLQQKTTIMDKINQRLPLLTNLVENEMLPELLDAYGRYAEKAFDSARFETTYRELAEAYKKWNILREIISLQKMMNMNTNEPMCAICLNEPVSHVMIPCGHTFCVSCTRKLHVSCYICRGGIRDRVRLYFT